MEKAVKEIKGILSELAMVTIFVALTFGTAVLVMR